MFGRRLKLFKLLGFEVRIDSSWFIIAILVAWSLSRGVFPFHYKNLSTETYWLMGIVGAVGLFLSIVAHEFCHSLVARKYGIPMKGITLFIFGGVAEMGDEPSSAKAEFMMAAAGPLSSILIALVFYGMYMAGKSALPEPVSGVTEYLAYINGILAAFNLAPAFPLDGGRILRSILWGVKKDLRWATRISANIGSAFGILLIVLGVFHILRGDFIGGMWWFLIGMFVQGAAKASYQQLVTRKALEGVAVRRFMQKNPVTVSPSMSLKHLVDDYIYQHHFKMFPVIETPDKLIGFVTTKQVKEIPREAWGGKTVGEVAVRSSAENTVEPGTDSVQALSLMRKYDLSRLLVAERGHLVGIITLRDLMKFLAVKVELDEPGI